MFSVVVVVVVIIVYSLFLSSHYSNIIKTNTTSTSQLPFECFSYIKIILYLQTTIGKDGQKAP